MTYTAVTFGQSFEDWAAANNIPCTCKRVPHHNPDGHHPDCAMTAALAHWRQEGLARYQTVKHIPSKAQQEWQDAEFR